MGVSFESEECFDLFGPFFWDILCVKVTTEGEVGYRLVIEGITGG